MASVALTLYQALLGIHLKGQDWGWGYTYLPRVTAKEYPDTIGPEEMQTARGAPWLTYGPLRCRILRVLSSESKWGQGAATDP